MSVRFIRVRGRVVPIRDKSKSESKPISPLVKTVAAGAVAVAAYLAIRRFRPSINPLLGKLQRTVEARGAGVAMLNDAPMGFWSRVQGGIFGMKVNSPAGVYYNYGGHIPGLKATQINPVGISKTLHDPAKYLSRVPKVAKPRTEILKDALARGARLDGKLIKERAGGMRKLGDFTLSSSALSRPNRFIAQEKLKLTGEYRVHVLDGHVFGISHRYNPSKLVRKLMPGGGAFVPVISPTKRAAIKSFVAKNHPKFKGHSFAGLDIADTAKGLKIIEANPYPGTLGNPLVSRQFVRHATGRWGRDVAGAGGLAAGGSTYAILSRKRRK